MKMRMMEIENGQQITIKSYKDDKEICFQTICTGKNDTGILLEPIRDEKSGELVNFHTEEVQNDAMLAREGELPIVWHDVKVGFLRIKDEYYHVLSGDAEGMEENKRKDYRVSVAESGELQVGLDNVLKDVMVKNVSNSGFAFVTTPELEITPRDVLRLGFMCYDEEITLLGNAVRRQVTEEGKVVYGCKITRKSKKLSEFITFRQRQYLRKRNGISE